MDREEILIENTDKLYGIVLGKFTPPLRPTIKGDAGYEKKSSDFDTLWLLQKIKETTAGVDMKENIYLTLHEQMIISLNTKHSKTESDDNYLKKFNSRLENMNLDGGAHVLCIPQIIGKYLSQCNTAEINTEKEIIKAMCFILGEIKVSNEICYRNKERENIKVGTNTTLLCLTLTNFS